MKRRLKTKRIFLVARRVAHVSHILAASLDELFQLLLLFRQRRHFGRQLLSLAQTPLHFQQTAAPVWETRQFKTETSLPLPSTGTEMSR